jgi:hypothetical protein
VVLISTELYNGQDANWPYLAPESGQHVFFYTKAALEHVAQRYGYKLVLGGSFQLFLRPNVASKFQAKLLSWLLRPRACRLIMACMLLLPTPAYGVITKARDLFVEIGRARAMTQFVSSKG